MNTLTHWDPFREFDDIQSRLSSVLGRRSRQEGGDKEVLARAEWAPLVDIAEDEKEYVVKAELPELSRENLRVTVENGTLIISGERKFEKEENAKKYHRIERSYGTFARSFGLPEDADAEKVDADFKDGVLKVRIGKSEAARPKQIEVKVN